ncbi:hypothetical protein [Flavobacterium sp.]|uniref:hypothetical protein n=1 Tax=Flavobacterium sp. TaxID=239 RepID=UPI0040346E9E
MEKYLFAGIIVFLIFSCNSSDNQSIEYQELLNQNAELRKKNIFLTDSLESYREDLIRSYILIGIPNDPLIRVGKKNNIKLLFHPFSVALPKYDIYEVNGSKEIKIGSNNKTEFDYAFVPKSTTDNQVYLKVKIPNKNDTIEIPAHMILTVEN